MNNGLINETDAKLLSNYVVNRVPIKQTNCVFC